MNVYIYGLYDPREPKRIRYVGKTNNLAKRLEHHLYSARVGKKTYKDRWIRKIIREGFYPEITILEETSQDDWQMCERSWIAKLENLTNTTAGGQGVDAPRTPVWRARIGAAHRGRVHSTESRKKISEAVRGNFISGCAKGHPWTLSSTGIDNRGDRYCRICDKERDIKNKRRKGIRTVEQFNKDRVKETCKRGHPLSGENLRLLPRKNGRIERICRQCVRDRNRECKRRRRIRDGSKSLRS